MTKDNSSIPASDERTKAGENPGISNRESAEEESAERAAHPPVDTSGPRAEDAAGRVDEEASGEPDDVQTSHKAGSRSTAQKQTESRYSDRTMPASAKVPGAFGKEPES